MRRGTPAFVGTLLSCLGATTQGVCAASVFNAAAATFEPNVGQGPPGSLYVARGPGFTASFGPAGKAAFRATSGDPVTFHLQLDAAAATSMPLPLGRRNAVSSYFLGSDAARWRPSVPQFDGIRYTDIYPDVDLLYRIRPDGRLEYDFVVGPRGDEASIGLEFSGAIELSSAGELQLREGGMAMRQLMPIIYEETGGERVLRDGAFILEADCRIRFQVGERSAIGPLVIDPIVDFATYLGGTESSTTKAHAIGSDAAGSVYVGGYTGSATFPVMNPYQSQKDPASIDGFLSKFDAQGQTLLYSTFFGGSGADVLLDIAVAPDGSVYVVGDTGSRDFPVFNAYQPVFASTSSSADSIVARFDPSGTSLVFSTYWGGNDDDRAGSAELDSSGGVLLGGATRSTNFPVLNAFQSTRSGLTYDGFVSRLSPQGVPLYSTYFGGAGSDEVLDVATAPTGAICLTGDTLSDDFPLANAFQSTHSNLALPDAFVACLEPDGRTLRYSTYLGGTLNDLGEGIALDSSGSAWVSGTTESNDFPAVAALNPSYLGGSLDLFLARLSAAGTPIFSTFLGGRGTDGNQDAFERIRIDPDGQGVLCSTTTSPDVPMVDPVQGTLRNIQNALLLRMLPDGKAMTFATYLGGSLGNVCHAIDVDAAGSIYIAGDTSSSDFPVVRPFQPQNTAFISAFVAKLTCGPDSMPSDLGNVLRAVRRGGDVHAEWTIPAPGPWRLYADPDKRTIGVTGLSPDLFTRSFDDINGVGNMRPLALYALRGLSPCTRLPGP